MSWLYSQVLVEEYLGENFLDGEQSAPLSGKPTQQAYCAPGKMTDFSRVSRFGMMFKPLTENLGEELLMSFREAFLAKTSQPLEKVQESMESDQECGEKWRGSFTKYDQDLSLWKTHQCSLLEDLEEFSETWPQWGLMRDGECWEQKTLEQTTRGTESGFLLPTPDTVNRDNKKVLFNRNAVSQSGRSLATYARTFPNQFSEETNNGGQLNPNWVEWLMGWPVGWTDLKPLAMDKSHFVPQQHGEFLAKEIDE
jgi:hypothetical protein